MLVTLK